MTRHARSSLLTMLTWAIVVVTLLPIAWLLLSSLRNYSDIAAGDQLSAELPLRWSNYRDIWVNVDFFNYFENSLIVCGSATAISTACALCAASALARFRFRGSNAVTLSISMTQVIPGMLFFLPLYMLYRNLGESWGLQMLDTYHGLVFLYVALFTPASIWIMRGLFVSIP